MIKRITLIFMPLLFAACCLYAAGETSALMEKGVEYCRAGLYDEAIKQFDKVIEMEPENAEAYNNRGIAYFARVSQERTHGKDFKKMVEDVNSADADFTSAIKLNPDLTSAYYNRGLMNIAQFEKAIIDFSRVIALKPDHAKAYYYRAVEYYNLKDYTQSWRDVNKAKELGYDVDSIFLGKLKKVSPGGSQGKI